MYDFDYNATTPLSKVARDAWLQACEAYPGNPSSPHRLGSRADRALTEARESLGSLLGVPPLDLVWTGGATESSNMVFHHAAQRLGNEARVWVSAIEHPCVMEAAQRYFSDRVDTIPVSSDGAVSLDELEKASKQGLPGLVAVMAANNETGVLQPWEAVADWCQERAIPYFCDAAQWLGKMPAAGLGKCAWVSGCAHKFGGPRGVGFLKCPAGEAVTPLLVGGPQEWSRRAGTENLPAVLSLMAALLSREGQLASEWINGQVRMREAVEARLAEALPELRVVGGASPRLWNTLSLIMPDCDCRFRWVVKLDRSGFAVSTGSACSSGKEEPSHVLQAMGYSNAEASRAIRCSSGPETSESDWAALADAILQIAEEAPAPTGEPAASAG